MANGISSVDLVSSLAANGNLAFYGAAGQTPDRVDEALSELERRHPGGSWGCNLIHSPSEPTIEATVAQLLIQKRIRHVEAERRQQLLPVQRHRNLPLQVKVVDHE